MTMTTADFEVATDFYPDIEYVEAPDDLHDPMVLYRGMTIGSIHSDPVFGYVFSPIVSFDDPIDMDATEAESLEELADRIDTEISYYRDLLDDRVESGVMAIGI